MISTVAFVTLITSISIFLYVCVGAVVHGLFEATEFIDGDAERIIAAIFWPIALVISVLYFPGMIVCELVVTIADVVNRKTVGILTRKRNALPKARVIK